MISRVLALILVTGHWSLVTASAAVTPIFADTKTDVVSRQDGKTALDLSGLTLTIGGLTSRDASAPVVWNLGSVNGTQLRGKLVFFDNAAPIAKPSGSILSALANLHLVGLPTINFSELTGTASAVQVPSLDASKITSGVFSLNRIPALDPAHISALDASKITSGVFAPARLPDIDWSKITGTPSTAEGYGLTLTASDIPALDWSKITSGKPTTATGYGFTLTASDIPALDWSKITTGKPTTASGYGFTLTASDIPALDWSKIATGKPTTASGYGFTLTAADIPPLDTSKITTGTFPETAIPSLPQSRITNLPADLGTLTTSLSSKAADSAVVHNTGTETVAGVKTFVAAPVVPVSAFPQSAILGLVPDLTALSNSVAVKATDNAVVHLAGSETITGPKTFFAQTSNVSNLRALAPPGAPTVLPWGASGTSTWAYKIVAKTSDGTATQAGPITTIVTGNANLNTTNYNIITWSAVAGAASYDVYRIASSGGGKFINVTAPTCFDQGQPADGLAPPAFNSTGNLVYRDAAGAAIPTRTIYLSKAGAKLDSNIDTGGGTNDTAVIQAVLDLAPSVGNLEVVVDGVALIDAPTFNATGSCLTIHSNTTLRFLPGAGFFLTANTTASRMLTTDLYGTRYSNKNIRIIGGVLNANRANQVLSGTPFGMDWRNEPGFVQSPKTTIWFNWCDGIYLEDLILRNPVVYATRFSDDRNIEIRNLRLLWDQGGVADDMPNTDGLHFDGPISNVKIDGLRSNGNDDVLAFNTTEGYTTGDPRRSSDVPGGPITNVVAENIFFDHSAAGIRFYGSGPTIYPPPILTGTLDNIVIRNVYGSVLGTRATMLCDNVTMGTVTIDGWNLTVDNGNIAQNVLRVNDTARLILRGIQRSVFPTFTNIASFEGEWGPIVSSTTVAASVFRNVDTSIPNATATALSFNAERSDSYAMHSTATNPTRVIFPFNGNYSIEGFVKFYPNTAGYRGAELRLNGVRIAHDTRNALNSTGEATAFAFGRSIAVNAGDYVELFVYQNSGGALSIIGNSLDSSELTVTRQP